MKLFRVISWLVLTLILGISCAFGQDSQEMKSGDTEKKMPEKSMATMPMPKPSPEMQKLTKMLVGTWHTVETFEVSDMMPKGGKGSGIAVIKPGPGGLSVVEDYHSRGGMGAFSGHGVFWWDDKAQGYKSIWCDNTTPNGCSVANGLGKFEGENLVFNDEQDMMGKKMAMKETLTSDKPGKMMFVMEAGEDGGPMKKMMTINYTKGSTAPKTTASDQPAPAKP